MDRKPYMWDKVSESREMSCEISTKGKWKSPTQSTAAIERAKHRTSRRRISKSAEPCLLLTSYVTNELDCLALLSSFQSFIGVSNRDILTIL